MKTFSFRKTLQNEMAYLLPRIISIHPGSTHYRIQSSKVRVKLNPLWTWSRSLALLWVSSSLGTVGRSGGGILMCTVAPSRACGLLVWWSNFDCFGCRKSTRDGQCSSLCTVHAPERCSGVGQLGPTGAFIKRFR